MIKFEDVNKVYTDTLNKKISISVAPAIIGNDYNIQLSITNLIDVKNQTVILNEYQARNLKDQLSNIFIHFHDLKKESK